MKDNFKDDLKLYTSQVEESVYSYLPEENGLQKIMFEAMNYSVKNGGKRLRPLMVRESFRAFGGKTDDEKLFVEPFMAAIEMIHSYSLVHDDLPDMDNDMYRRGKLTTHAAFGADMGILAGDSLLNYAFETIAKAELLACEKDTSMLVRMAKAFSVLATKAGVYGMIGGQTVDVKLTGKKPNDEEIDFIYKLKTGALIEASLMMGAILAGASDEQVTKIEEVGQKVGLAFQIKDDILDETSTAEVLGKPIHSDVENDKTTYVTLHGIVESERMVKEYSEDAMSILDKLFDEETFLKDLIQSLIDRDR